MILPHGAVGWSAVCDLVFIDHSHLLLFSFISMRKRVLIGCLLVFLLLPACVLVSLPLGAIVCDQDCVMSAKAQ